MTIFRSITIATVCILLSGQLLAQEPEKNTEYGRGTNEKVVPVFMPALVAILLAAEKNKGSELTKKEVLKIRDESTVVMVRPSVALEMKEARGYEDVEAENCWESWQAARNQMKSTGAGEHIR